MKKIIQYSVTFLLCTYIGVTSLFSMRNSLLPVGSRVYHGVLEGQTLQAIIDRAESAFKSNIYQKGKLVKIDSILTYLMTKNINSVQVLQGKDDWLFYKSETDGDPIADYKGTNVFTEEEMKETLQTLSSIDEKLGKMGIPLTLMVAPNKESVYFEYMPDEVERVSQKSRTDSLIEYLQQNSALNIVCPKQALMDNKAEFPPLYYKYDTHWNQLGGYIGVQQIMKSWGLPTEELSQQLISQEPLHNHLSAQDDLAKMTGLTRVFRDIDYIVGETDAVDWKAIEEQGVDDIHLMNDKAPYQETILLIGDSFRAAMIPELLRNFGSVYVIHRNVYKPEMLNEIAPDRVIVEYVERYSGNIKTAIV